MTRLSRWLVSLTLVPVLVLTSCSTAAPPEGLKQSIDALPTQIKDVRGALDQAKADFDKKLGDGKYAFLKAYTPAQQHTDRFDQAKAKLDAADKAYNDKVKPVADNYNDGRQGELEAAVGEVNKQKDEARALILEPTQWADKVVATKADPATVVTKAKTTSDSLKTSHDTLAGDLGTAKQTFPKQVGAIDRLIAPLTKLQTDAALALGNLQTESSKKPPNYALMTEYAQTVASNRESFTKDESGVRGKLGELPTTESHTLLDIRVDSAVEIGRTSWDDASDFPTEHDYDYPSVPVDMDTANYFAQFQPGTQLAHDGWGFSTEGHVDRAQWDKLGIDPGKDWPSSWDDAAEYYFDGLEETYCHQLRVLKNGKPDLSQRPKPEENPCDRYNNEGDLKQGICWVEADDLDPEAIGMDIYSKGAGDFNDQATDEATPPGMAYVGDPNAGQWQTDSSGNSFWAFYGQYAFFSQLIGGPNPYHYRYEYDAWNGGYRYNHQPYYAGSSSSPRYGAKAPQAASRFPNSSFNKSGLRDATVRNAGPAARAGGPGGGGK